MHAEMQLIEELREAYLLDKVTYIGVSKPCCKYCKQVLNRYHIDYLHYHTDAVQHWEDPEVGGDFLFSSFINGRSIYRNSSLIMF